MLSLPVLLIVGAAAVLIAVGGRRALAALPELVLVGGPDGYPVLALVTFQNVAASLATMASVPRVALVVSLARDGSAGVDSGRVLRTVLAVDIVVLVSLSGIAVLLPGTLFA